LTIEGAALVGEQLAHHPRVRPRKHVGGGVAVVLDDTANQPIKPLPRSQHDLELIEGNDKPCAAALVKREGQIQEIK
jgi:hypothetical protein